MEAAKEAAVSDTLKNSVDTPLQETYLAFSNSDGYQARQAMKEALKTVCEKHKKPSLPIFGLNKNAIRIGIYGIEDRFPEDIVARTPGEMHYIACVDVEKRTIDSSNYGVEVNTPDGKYDILIFKQSRVKIYWNISLRKSDTGEELGTNSFEGGPPPPYSGRRKELGNDVFEGTPPDLNAVIEWLRTFIKPTV